MRALAQAVLPPLLKTAELVTAALLFLMLMLTFVDVVGRYVFTAPVFGAAEMIQFLLAMTIFGGLCLINARDEHITVELFESHIDRYIPRLRPVLVQVFSVAVMTIITVELFEFALDAQRVGTRTIVLEWPFAVVAFTVSGLCVVSLIAQILGLMLPPETHRPEDRGGGL